MISSIKKSSKFEKFVCRLSVRLSKSPHRERDREFAFPKFLSFVDESIVSPRSNIEMIRRED